MQDLHPQRAFRAFPQGDRLPGRRGLLPSPVVDPQGRGSRRSLANTIYLCRGLFVIGKCFTLRVSHMSHAPDFCQGLEAPAICW